MNNQPTRSTSIVLLTVENVLSMINLSRQQLSRLRATKNFPSPVHLDIRRTLWRQADVLDWMQQKLNARATTPISIKPGDRFISIAAVLAATKLSRQKLLSIQDTHNFPLQIQITQGRIVWLEREVQTWTSTTHLTDESLFLPEEPKSARTPLKAPPASQSGSGRSDLDWERSVTKFNFTDLALKHLSTPSARMIDYQDAQQAGFGLRVYQTGTKTFFYRYRFGGKLQRLNLGTYPATKLADARKNARKAQIMAREGFNPKRHKTFNFETPALAGTAQAQTNANALFLPPIIEIYIKEYCPSKRNAASTIADKKRTLENIANTTWRNKTLPEITTSMVSDLLDTIVSRKEFALANKTYRYLRHFFNFTVDKGYIETSPCDRMKKPCPDASRSRFLSPDEIRVLWRVAEDHAFPFGYIAQLALLTGQRRNEIAHMKWSEINVADKTWEIPGTRTKNKKDNIVPLSDTALSILVKIRALQNTTREPIPRGTNRPPPGYHPKSSKYVFPSMASPNRPCSGISNAKNRMARDAKIFDWRIHDLRRTVTTHLGKLSVPQEVKKRILNHALGKDVTDVYDRYDYLDQKREALQLWADTIKSYLASQPETIDDLVRQLNAA